MTHVVPFADRGIVSQTADLLGRYPGVAYTPSLRATGRKKSDRKACGEGVC